LGVKIAAPIPSQQVSSSSVTKLGRNAFSNEGASVMRLASIRSEYSESAHNKQSEYEYGYEDEEEEDYYDEEDD
jgi:hypothetical protein